MAERRRLGEILVAHDVLTGEQLESALAASHTSDGRERLGEAILRLGYATEEDVAEALAAQMNLERIDAELVIPDLPALELLAHDVAQRSCVLPLRLDDDVLVVAMGDPTDIILIDDLKLRTGVKTIRPVVARPSRLRDAIASAYGGPSDMLALVRELEPAGGPAEDDPVDDAAGEAPPIVRLANQIMLDAVRMRASDVHIEPGRDGAQVRLRIDGILKKVAELPRSTRGPLTSRFKILGGMDIAERRRPQDGRTLLSLAGNEVDVRMSTMPSMHGETLVMRLLRRRQENAGFDGVGMEPPVERMFRQVVGQPQGIILVTGPTGSGKTTTLYAALSHLASEERNVLTLEDPIEYELGNVNQTQINAKVGLTFAAGMRSVLRQDPDVIMVGEIRDMETAKLAVDASMTGHLVLSTLHTNDALSTVSRLAELDVDRSQLAASLLMVVSQRLARVVCPHCGEDAAPDPGVLERLDLPASALDHVTLRRGSGCAACAETGYLGRTMVCQALRFTPELGELVIERSRERTLRQVARSAGMRTLREDGLRLALAGVTTLDEVVRVTPDDPDLPTRELIAQLTGADPYDAAPTARAGLNHSALRAG